MPQTDTHDLSFLQRCTVVKVSFGNLRSSKKLPRTTVNAMVTAVEEQTSTPQDGVATEPVRSDPRRVTANKKLWECDQADAIKAEFTRLGKFVRQRTVPSPFGKGIYFVPNTLVGEVDAELEVSSKTTIPHLTEALIAVYEDVMRREEIALAGNFNPRDYETPSELRDRLRVEFFYTTFGIPENLPDVIRMREAEKQGQRLTEAVDGIQALLRAEFADLVNHAAEKLSGKTDDGKPLTFRNSLVGNIREFLDLFSARNITNDQEMEALTARAKSLLSGVDSQQLRDQEPLRESTARAFQEIRNSLDGMMTARGSRQIRFEEDEAEVTAA